MVIPATANTELPALAQTQSAPGTPVCPHSPFLSGLHQKQAVLEGKANPLQSLSTHAGQCILRGTAREVAEASLCWPGYTEHVTGGTNTSSVQEVISCDHQAALTGFSPPWRYREQL